MLKSSIEMNIILQSFNKLEYVFRCGSLARLKLPFENNIL